MQPNTVNDTGLKPSISLDTLIGEEEYHAITSPPYIPMNFGAAARTSLTLDIQMMAIFNAQERTLVSCKQNLRADSDRYGSASGKVSSRLRASVLQECMHFVAQSLR